MAALGQSNLTLADHAKRLDPDGKTSMIVEALSQTNEIITDMSYIEGNLPTGHRTTIRTGLPPVYWRKLNQGIPSSKSSTAQVTESCAFLEARSEVDVRNARLGGDVGGFRLSESMAFIESMSQEHSSTIFYGNETSAPEEFTGLSTRYSSLSGEISQNVVSGSGSGSDQSSIWLIVWGDNQISGMFPKGMKAGLNHQDLGEIDAFDENNNRFRAYADLYTWDCGIVVKDWRYAVRICNIDTTQLVAESSDADISKLMIKALHRIPNLRAGRAAWYMNRTCFEYLDLQGRRDVKAAAMTYTDIDGMPRYHFRQVPVRICDSLTVTEAAVS